MKVSIENKMEAIITLDNGCSFTLFDYSGDPDDDDRVELMLNDPHETAIADISSTDYYIDFKIHKRH